MVDIGIGTGLGFFSAVLPVCVGAIGTGIAMSSIGSAAMGYLAEKEGAAGTVMVFVALPETIIILGFVLSFMVLGAVNAAIAGTG